MRVLTDRQYGQDAPVQKVPKWKEMAGKQRPYIVTGKGMVGRNSLSQVSSARSPDGQKFPGFPSHP